MSSAVLEDERYRVPAVPAGSTGLTWLRAAVPRFCDGPEHARRRGLVELLLDGLPVAAGGDPTVALLRALGLPGRCADDVAAAAAAYQPHAPQSPEADAAVERLVTACGGRDDAAAARICVLVQAHAATRALRADPSRPPVPATRRIAPDGRTVEVDLADAWFGRGPHACPGRSLAERLAAR